MPNQTDGSSPRIIKATRHSRADKLIGPINILAYTKHGTTAIMSVHATEKLDAGDILRTTVWILNSKHFVVIQPHQKPMKLPGTWYEVQVVPTPKS